jgi:hypothetical protein
VQQAARTLIENEMRRWFIIVLKIAITALILALFLRQFDIRAGRR